MKFLVVTPSYNQLIFLKQCVASVRDQAGSLREQMTEDGLRLSRTNGSERGQRTEGGSASSSMLTSSNSITVHHHIQDGGSTDGTVEWLRQYDAEVRGQKSEGGGQRTEDGGQRTEVSDQHLEVGKNKIEHLSPDIAIPGYTFSYESVSDNGMYDAINRGWERADRKVDVIAHLNCDEQYLPGALDKIALFFLQHEKADVVLADMIVVDINGSYICHRRSLKPYVIPSTYCCMGMTTTTFQRATNVLDKKVMFDTSWRNIGDMIWYNDLLKAGARFMVYNSMVSIFTDTGQNLNLTDEAVRERKRYTREYLSGKGWGIKLISKYNGVRRLFKELFMTPPKQYALYLEEGEERVVLPIRKPNHLWRRKGPVIERK